MKRSPWYILFALLGFGIGVMATRVGGVGDFTGIDEDRSPIILSSTRSATKSPTLSFEQYPEQPLGMFYDSTYEMPGSAGRVRVNFLFKNTSHKSIVKYTIGCRFEPASGHAAAGDFNQVFQGSALESGEFEKFVLETQSDSRLSLRVNDIEFEDGARWSFSSPQ